jgi:hypothetical protein
MKEEQKEEILIYQSEEGKTKIEVRLENETANARGMFLSNMENLNQTAKRRII